jgi:hypothetical protein
VQNIKKYKQALGAKLWRRRPRGKTKETAATDEPSK